MVTIDTIEKVLELVWMIFFITVWDLHNDKAGADNDQNPGRVLYLTFNKIKVEALNDLKVRFNKNNHF